MPPLSKYLQDTKAEYLAARDTDALLLDLLHDVRREQWQADPLLFAREVFPQHFSRPPAAMHRVIMQAVTEGGRVAQDTGEVEAGKMPGVGESPPLENTILPYSPPLSAPIPEAPIVHEMNTEEPPR